MSIDFIKKGKSKIAYVKFSNEDEKMMIRDLEDVRLYSEVSENPRVLFDFSESFSSADFISRTEEMINDSDELKLVSSVIGITPSIGRMFEKMSNGSGVVFHIDSSFESGLDFLSSENSF